MHSCGMYDYSGQFAFHVRISSSSLLLLLLLLMLYSPTDLPTFLNLLKYQLKAFFPLVTILLIFTSFSFDYVLIL